MQHGWFNIFAMCSKVKDVFYENASDSREFWALLMTSAADRKKMFLWCKVSVLMDRSLLPEGSGWNSVSRMGGVSHNISCSLNKLYYLSSHCGNGLRFKVDFSRACSLVSLWTLSRFFSSLKCCFWQ